MDKINQNTKEILNLIRNNFIILIVPILASFILSLTLNFNQIITEPISSKKNSIKISINKIEKDNFLSKINTFYFERDRKITTYLYSVVSYPASESEKELLEELKNEQKSLISKSQISIDNIAASIIDDIYNYLNDLNIKQEYNFDLSKDTNLINVNQNFSGNNNLLLEMLNKEIKRVNNFYKTSYIYNFEKFIHKESSLSFQMIDLINQVRSRELKNLQYELRELNIFLEDTYPLKLDEDTILAKKIALKELKIQIDLLETRSNEILKLNNINYFKKLHNNDLLQLSQITDNSFKNFIKLDSSEKEVIIDYFTNYIRILIQIILFLIGGAIISSLILLYKLSFSNKKI